jgi:hypothetical protein
MAWSIGHTDKANHQYDLTDFWAASQGGNMPAISYLKAPAYQNGHPGYSATLCMILHPCIVGDEGRPQTGLFRYIDTIIFHVRIIVMRT